MIRQLFNCLSTRERILLSMFFWALLLIWLLGLLDGYSFANNERKENNRIISSLNEMLELSDIAEIRLAEARDGLDSSQTYSASQLVGRLDSLAREAEFSSFDLSIPSTQDTDLFSFHNVRLNIKSARIEDLMRFDRRIKEHAPYIALSQFQLTSNRRDPRYLDAVLELSSFELKEDAIND